MWILTLYFIVNGTIQTQDLSQFKSLEDCKYAIRTATASPRGFKSPMHFACNWKKDAL